MASVLYPDYKEKLLLSTASALDSGTIKVVLIDVADYIYSAAHNFFDDVPAAARVATATLGAKTTNSPAQGVFDAGDVTFPTVAGDPCEALIIYEDTGGADSTDPLIAYIDGFTVTPNGFDIIVQWDNGGNRIFAL